MQKTINGFYVYAYHHDDDRRAYTPLDRFSHKVLDGPFGEEKEKETITPSFVEKLSATVKAYGTSWVASKYPLNADDLEPRFLFEDTAKAGR
jgi:hypothetical protein